MFFNNMYPDTCLPTERTKKKKIFHSENPCQSSIRMTAKISDADFSSPAEVQKTLRLFSPDLNLYATLPKADQLFHKHLYRSRIISDRIPSICISSGVYHRIFKLFPWITSLPENVRMISSCGS